MMLNLPKIFSQRDARWKNNRLGFSRLTIGGYGCLITCYAMVLRYFGRKTDPAMVNRLITKHGGYTKSGLYYWQTLAKIYGYKQKVVDAQKRMLTKSELQEIIDTIEKKKIPVIVQVDMNPNTAKSDMHFVVAYGYDGGKLYIADPWTKKTYALRAKYFGIYIKSLRRAIYRYVIFAPRDWNGNGGTSSTPEPKKPQTSKKWAFGVDISHYQGRVDYKKLSKAVDFVIMKATEATKYIDPTLERNRKGAKEYGMLKGYYHFARGGNAKDEARHFIATVGHLDQHDLLVLDWEISHRNPVGWCLEFLDYVYKKTGVRPLLYTNEARVRTINWAPVAKEYGLWVARYHQNDGKLHGKPATGAWKTFVLHQYTSRGRVDGINGNVDMNYCPHGLDVLKRYGAVKSTTPTQPQETPEVEPPKNDNTNNDGKYCFKKDYKKKYRDCKDDRKDMEKEIAKLQEKLKNYGACQSEVDALQNENAELVNKINKQRNDLQQIRKIAGKW